MQTAKTVLRLAAAIAVAAACIGSLAYGAEVTKVNAGEGHVYIDAGKADGFTMNTEVCFYSLEGKQITCGRVRQTSAARAMVRVKSRQAKFIKPGMAATLKTEGAD